MDEEKSDGSEDHINNQHTIEISYLVFNVIHYHHDEMYNKLGMKEFGFYISCSHDEPFFRGFNS